jgi:hypothetical protein
VVLANGYNGMNAKIRFSTGRTVPACARGSAAEGKHVPACAAPRSGQGQVVSATLITDIGKITFGGVLGQMKVGLLLSVFGEMEVVRDVDRFTRRGITEEE